MFGIFQCKSKYSIWAETEYPVFRLNLKNNRLVSYLRHTLVDNTSSVLYIFLKLLEKIP